MLPGNQLPVMSLFVCDVIRMQDIVTLNVAHNQDAKTWILYFKDMFTGYIITNITNTLFIFHSNNYQETVRYKYQIYRSSVAYF